MKWLAFRRSGGLEWRALYRLSVFNTDRQRAQGLSGLASWPCNRAALFQFDTAAPHRIHTQGMRFAIDIVASDADGYVIGWASRAQPNEAELFEAPPLTTYIIELAAGEIELRRLGHGLRIEMYDT